MRFLTGYTFVLRFSRENLQFRAGQKLVVGLVGDLDQREYSIYSGENDDFLEILVREVRDGNVSLKLKNCRPGDQIQANGPFGSFGIEEFDRYAGKHLFIATGTGISPFHSLVRSYPGINYTLIHGVRLRTEAYDRDEYEPARYILCTSKEKIDGRKGRVTSFLAGYRVSPGSMVYLCGNGSMIYEVYHMMRNKGVPAEKIFSEIYF